MNENSKILVIGANGMVGSAVVRMLKRKGFNYVKESTREDTNLLDRNHVIKMYMNYSPEYVFMCAAKVGGIKTNNEKRVEFLHDNALIALNTISEAYNYGVKKFLFLGSSCVYPNNFLKEIDETDILKGPFEKTNEPYALAKIVGLKLCEYYRTQYDADFISCMPCNIFGRGDNYDLQTGHVMAAMIRKIHEAKENGDDVQFIGTGKVLREFLYVDDVASALIFLMKNYSSEETINIGDSQDITVENLSEIIATEIGYFGKITFDQNEKMNGTFRKKVNTAKLRKLGWTKEFSLNQGIKKAYENFLQGQ